jgi:speckle-type POZ protein
VEPKVFEAMLHYMYTVALPETEEEDAAAAMSMAQGLLAAAQRFKIERLKLMCEETLAKRIEVSTVADTLAVAEQHGCRALKAACMEFMAHPANLRAVMATEGYDKIIKDKDCTHVMLDFAVRQLARD